MAITAPPVGASSSSNDVQKGTAVWRPGYSTTDKTKWPTAQYDLTNTQVWAIVNDQLKNAADQVKMKSLLVQSGYLSKKNFQTNYWSSDDTGAFLDLLKKSNADGVTWNERLASDIAGAATTGTAGGPSTTTSRTVSFSDPKTAQAIVQSSFRALLGRDPSANEYQQFTKTLSAAEAANPSVSTTTRTGAGNYNTKTTGGLTTSGSQMVIEQAMKGNGGLKTELINKRLNGYADVIAKLAGF